MKRFVVIGLGSFGASAAETLHGHGHDVLAIDTREECVERLAGRIARAVVADARNAKVLERLGARGAAAGIVATGDDITASILATMALRDLGVPEIYVKVISEDHARVMEQLGVTETIYPERDSAQRLGARIVSSAIRNFVILGTRFAMQEMAVPPSWVGRSLRELQIPQRYRVAVIAVHDVETDTMTPTPAPDDRLTTATTLLVAGRVDDLARLVTPD